MHLKAHATTGDEKTSPQAPVPVFADAGGKEEETPLFHR